ncbi:MAG: hypothetical protein LC768_11895 [Acidobacteria bacterium]|nr:hypothetical protein [Acidobacteriota bacterium]MCA1639012.1 hypothetical protein [Acidobacteriota bacterium]
MEENRATREDLKSHPSVVEFIELLEIHPKPNQLLVGAQSLQKGIAEYKNC